METEGLDSVALGVSVAAPASLGEADWVPVGVGVGVNL